MMLALRDCFWSGENFALHKYLKSKRPRSQQNTSGYEKHNHSICHVASHTIESIDEPFWFQRAKLTTKCNMILVHAHPEGFSHARPTGTQTHTHRHTRTHAQHVTVEESALSVRHWIATYRTRQIVDSPKLQANAMYFQLLNNCEKTDCCREMGIQGVLFNPCPVDILASHKARVRLHLWISS